VSSSVSAASDPRASRRGHLGGAARVGLVPQGTAERDGGPVISFQPDGDIAEAKRELESRGVQFPADISEHPWGRIATFKDSEGNDLQLYAPPLD